MFLKHGTTTPIIFLNPLRYHITSNYIYNQYEPFSVINGYNIWIKKGTKIKKEKYIRPDSTVTDAIKNYQLKFLPYLLGKSIAFEKDSILKQVIDQIDTSNTFILKRDINKSKGTVLELEISNPTETSEGKVSYFQKGKLLGTIEFTIPNEPFHRYRLPVGCQYNWHKNKIDSITFESNKNVQIQKAYLLKGFI